MPIMLDIGHLDCDGCPASHLRNTDRIRHVEALRSEALSALGADPRWIVLCESVPANRFVYDKDSDYANSGLRFNLRNELVPGQDDDVLFRYLDDRRIWIVDAALCPLHELGEEWRDRRHAATLCLERHTRSYLDSHPSAPLVTILPRNCGFRKRQLPRVQARVVAEFRFSHLDGLKELLEG